MTDFGPGVRRRCNFEEGKSNSRGGSLPAIFSIIRSASQPTYRLDLM